MNTVLLYTTALLLLISTHAAKGDFCTTNCSVFRVGMGIDRFLRYAPQDQLIMQGVQFWVDWVNEKGGLPMNGTMAKVELVTRDIDSANAATMGAKIAEEYGKLVTENKVDMLVSPYATPRIVPAANVAEAANVTNFIIGATELAVKTTYKSTVSWVFPVADLGAQSLYTLADKAKSYVIITGTDTLTPGFGKGAAAYLDSKGLTSFGIVAPNASLAADNSQLEIQIRTVLADVFATKGYPDIIVASFLQDQFANVINAITALKPNVKALVSINAQTRTYFKDNKINVDPNYWITVSGFDRELNFGTSGVLGGTSAEYFDAFNKKFSHDPDTNAALTTAAMMVWYKAFIEVNSTKVSDVMKHLTNMSLVNTLGGDVKLNSYGLNFAPKLYSFQFQGETAVFVNEKSVIYPAPFSWLQEEEKKANTTVIVAVVIPVAVVIFAIVAIGVFYVRKQRREAVSALVKTEEGERRAYKLDFNAMEVGTLLGSGSFGHVYSGVYRGADVAIKKLKHQNMTKKQLDEFTKEAGIMVGLRHPNIVLFMGVCLEPNKLCIVTEMMSRGSLQDVLASKNHISANLLHQMALDILKGLQFIHSTGLIHRDLKSPNLLVDSNWRIKIADFGLSCGKAHADEDDAQVSLLWTAPEILMKERNCYTEQSDVYSFGVILWEMFARSIPFMGKTPAFIHKAVVSGDRPDIDHSWPIEYVNIMKACWDPKATNRPTVKRVREMIEAIAPEEGADGGYLHASHIDTAPQGPIAVVVTAVKHADEYWSENPTAMHQAMDMYNKEMRKLITEFNGYEVKTYLHYSLVVFQDPIKAVNYTMKAQEELMKLQWPAAILQSSHGSEEKADGGRVLYRGFRVGMGINFGAPVSKRDPSSNRVEYTGPVFAHTLKMAEMVEGGHILITSFLYSRVMSQTSRVEAFQIESAGSISLTGESELASVFEIMPKSLEDRLTYVVPLEALHADSAIIHNSVGSLKKTGGSQKSINDPKTIFNDSALKEKWHIPHKEVHILSQIGIGIFGEVHAAIWNGNKVAVRTLLKQKENEASLLEMRKDISVLSKLNHPNIVKFYGVCCEVPHMGIIMEYFPNGSLNTLLYNTSVNLSWEQKKRFALDIARGMDHLHKNGIVHRDVKSGNMLLGQHQNVVVSDFGFYSLKEESQTMTQAGVVAYTAPEVFNGESYSKACDMYSYGIVLWEIVFRQKAWDRLHAMKVITYVATGERPSMNMPVDAPHAIKDIINGCWHNNPSSRPSFDAVVEQLTHL